MSPLKGGKWLIHHRERAGLTQPELAERAGISTSYISAIEREEPNARDGSPRRPKVEKVDRLAKVLQVPEDDARLAFGYAPKVVRLHEKPHNIPDLFERLREIGINVPDIPVMGHDVNTPEKYEKMLEEMAEAIAKTVIWEQQGWTRPTIEDLENWGEDPEDHEHREGSDNNERDHRNSTHGGRKKYG